MLEISLLRLGISLCSDIIWSNVSEEWCKGFPMSHEVLEFSDRRNKFEFNRRNPGVGVGTSSLSDSPDHTRLRNFHSVHFEIF